MNNSEPLVWYGLSVMIVCGLTIIVPYLRGKSDVLTAWNVLLLGMAMFTGFGCLEVAYGVWPWPNLQWFQPTRQEVNWYMFNTTLFLAALIGCYYYNPLGKAVAANRLRKWPPLNGSTYFFVLAFCAGVALATIVIPPRSFVGLVVNQLSHKAVVFACVFSFILWYKDRINMAWLALFVGVFLVAALFSMVVFSGRRLLLSVFLGPILSVYWISARHWKVRNQLAAVAVATAGILAVSLVYSSFRWYNRGPQKQERSASAIIAQLEALRTRQGLFQNLFANKINYFSQNNVHYALLAKRYVDTGMLAPIPLNTIRYIVSYPIPRKFWGGKPTTLGIVSARDVAHIPSTNWGLGPAGHAAYEGGPFAMLLYAMLAAMGVRLMDDPLRAQPGNPFLIALHAAALPHVAGFARGDFGIMTTEIGECFLFAFLLGLACRMLFGTEKVPTRTRSMSPAQRPGMLPPARQLSPPRLHR